MENNEQTSLNWYALYTNSRAEKKVLELMVQAGIEAYLPIKRELRQWSDRKKWVETPIINSYIFVRLHPDHLKTVYQINGVVAFVNSHGKPAVIPPKEIEAMQLTVNNQLAYTIEQHTLRKGETIRMVSGPLAGVEGEIVQIKGQNKLYLKISHIGFMMSVDVTSWEFVKV
ncbi:MAG: UpxY family transcription antiterminator [Breznakibacter sp.]